MPKHSVLKRIGCFADAKTVQPPLSGRGRAARTVAGMGFLAAAGFLGFVEFLPLPDLLLRGVAVVLAWFGISHLVASATDYQGCPEIGAIPTIVLKREIATNCDIWHRIDRVIGAGPPAAGACGCARR
jgi:hypothetical protein